MTTDVGQLMEDTLAVAVASIDAPDRQYIAHDMPAFDCEQITVHLAGMRTRQTDAQRGGDFASKCLTVFVAQLAVCLVRCVPKIEDDGRIPSPDEMTDAHVALANDGVAVMRGLSRARATGDWPEGLGCQAVTFGQMEPSLPLGGFAGWLLHVEVQIQ